MIVAIPTEGGRPSEHFCQSDAIRLLDIDLANLTTRENRVVRRENGQEMVQWLGSLMVDAVLVGSISFADQDRLNAMKIKVYPGGCICSIDGLVSAFVQGELKFNPAARAGSVDPQLCIN